VTVAGHEHSRAVAYEMEAQGLGAACADARNAATFVFHSLTRGTLRPG